MNITEMVESIYNITGQPIRDNYPVDLYSEVDMQISTDGVTYSTITFICCYIGKGVITSADVMETTMHSTTQNKENIYSHYGRNIICFLPKEVTNFTTGVPNNAYSQTWSWKIALNGKIYTNEQSGQYKAYCPSLLEINKHAVGFPRYGTRYWTTTRGKSGDANRAYNVNDTGFIEAINISNTLYIIPFVTVVL